MHNLHIFFSILNYLNGCWSLSCHSLWDKNKTKKQETKNKNKNKNKQTNKQKSRRKSHTTISTFCFRPCSKISEGVCSPFALLLIAYAFVMNTNTKVNTKKKKKKKKNPCHTACFVLFSRPGKTVESV